MFSRVQRAIIIAGVTKGKGLSTFLLIDVTVQSCQEIREIIRENGAHARIDVGHKKAFQRERCLEMFPQ